MYSTSRWTRVLVLVIWMTALEMYFMATLCPVMVCVATDMDEKKKKRKKVASTGKPKGDRHRAKGERRTLHFSKSALGDVANDGVLPELRSGE